MSRRNRRTDDLGRRRGRLSAVCANDASAAIRDAVLDSLFAPFGNASRTPICRGHAIQVRHQGSRGWARYYAGDGGVPPGGEPIGPRSIWTTPVSSVFAYPRRLRESGQDLSQETSSFRSRPSSEMVGLIPGDLGEAYVNQHLGLARVTEEFHPAFVAWYLTSPQGQRRVTRNGRGATKAGLGLDDIRSLVIPRPTRENQETSCPRRSRDIAP